MGLNSHWQAHTIVDWNKTEIVVTHEQKRLKRKEKRCYRMQYTSLD